MQEKIKSISEFLGKEIEGLVELERLYEEKEKKIKNKILEELEGKHADISRKDKSDKKEVRGKI